MKAVWAAGFLGFALSGAVVFLPSAALANEPVGGQNPRSDERRRACGKTP